MDMTRDQALFWAFTGIFLFGTALTVYARLAWGRPVRWLRRRRHRHA